MLVKVKQCTKCSEVKTLEHFHRYKTGLKPACKDCYSKIEKERRVKNGGTNYIDRSSETPELKICTVCLKLKPRNLFNVQRCKDCTRDYNQAYSLNKGLKLKFKPIVLEDSKQCVRCKEIKNLNEYSNAKRGRLGKAAYCKPCQTYLAVNKYTTQEERREKTQKYRDNNREWWRFLHRANQHNRRAVMKTQSDGTVTKEFMIELYETEICYYCEKHIAVTDRTCDHKQPLNKEGIHGKSNLVMACLSCNATKRDMTEEEFLIYKQNKL